jgi:hypothetical protein
MTADINLIIKESIQKGLERSCESLEFFLKEKATLEMLTFTNQRIEKTLIPSDFLQKEIILHSDIIGQLSGKSYFMLDQAEADLLFRKNFAVQEGKAPDKAMFDGFLLELDNIITASVVTEFANKLRVKVYGGVPHIFYMSTADKAPLTLPEPPPYFINFSCRYKMEGVEFSPVFFWVIDSEIEEYASGNVLF